MGKRNLIWLAVIVVIAVVVWVATSFVWGIVAAVVALVVSETLERAARRKRLAARGVEAPSIRDAVTRRTGR